MCTGSLSTKTNSLCVQAHLAIKLFLILILILIYSALYSASDKVRTGHLICHQPMKSQWL